MISKAMATVSQVRSTTLSGLNHIDALLGNLPNWNYQTGSGNTLYYTFSVSSGTEGGNAALLSGPSRIQRFATGGCPQRHDLCVQADRH
ncbi:hypothetical protein ACHMW6_22905 [Pseudoduganella sp. UC29_106]|uniref:hypothetical protein n=1 Tax=Pseudoduganella sp. UC29_106 TaxID=3374553 RepID=UPI003756FAFA